MYENVFDLASIDCPFKLSPPQSIMPIAFLWLWVNVTIPTWNISHSKTSENVRFVESWIHVPLSAPVTNTFLPTF